LRQLTAIIRKCGFVNPIIIDENNNVVAGNARLAAAIILQLADVPTIQIEHLNDDEKRAYALADNRIAQNAGWDRELLAVELGELALILPDLGLEIPDLGFSTGELDSLLSDHSNEDSSDPADHVVADPGQGLVTRQGDLWQLGSGKHRVLCGDAQIPAHLERLCGTGIVGQVITDPPYNVRVQGHVGGRGKTKHKEFAFASGEMSDEEYLRFLAVCIGNMLAASRPGALMYLFIDWRHVQILLQVCQGLGLELRNICVWSKTTPGQGSFYRSAHELVVVCQIPGGKAINNIELGRHGRNRTNVWSYPGVNTFLNGENDDLSLHPTVKPVAMIAEAIKDASDRGDIVLDPFLGSGTALLACEKIGRICYGLEFEPRYVDTAIRRWQEYTGRDAILMSTGGTLSSPQPGSLPTLPAFGNAPSLVGLTFDEVAEIRHDNAAASEGSSSRSATTTNRLSVATIAKDRVTVPTALPTMRSDIASRRSRVSLSPARVATRAAGRRSSQASQID
jgi:DNA modification methylase